MKLKLNVKDAVIKMWIHHNTLVYASILLKANKKKHQITGESIKKKIKM